MVICYWLLIDLWWKSIMKRNLCAHKLDGNSDKQDLHAGIATAYVPSRKIILLHSRWLEERNSAPPFKFMNLVCVCLYMNACMEYTCHMVYSRFLALSFMCSDSNAYLGVDQAWQFRFMLLKHFSYRKHPPVFQTSHIHSAVAISPASCILSQFFKGGQLVHTCYSLFWGWRYHKSSFDWGY